MSSIQIRKIVDTRYRVRLRPINLPCISLTFSSLDEAEKWIEEHEQKYIEDPETYQRWIQANRKSIKEKGIFHVHIPFENI